MRLNEVRSPDDDTPRTGMLWKEPIEEVIDGQDDTMPELVPRASGAKHCCQDAHSRSGTHLRSCGGQDSGGARFQGDPGNRLVWLKMLL